MYYKITVDNGHFPLVRDCSTAHEAFGCIEELSTGLLHNLPFDMDGIMENLMRMKNNDLSKTRVHGYTIERMEGEI
ncbi:hypothetical protein Sgly_0367 [Syntrophobotulus glycolicus DSM 8271]|uniref:Uncharacterized protein n=1 Tax=Syntrophobotulus glycolicus (strain DSM 8271 / FlGlyR) TaxID=645991 RepID=F0SXI7_SYNGF|nr:hypothetical protein [Syntrophobotulus glycolicus]ADY54733.1 hypothetical protein Sgly_0367 [Syntrophobotulus glycolicus DSM 8271]